MSSATTAQRPQTDFAIEIRFEPETGYDPARVFKSMSQLIDAFQDLDRGMMQSVDSSIEPVLMLEGVETGSLRAWLRSQLSTVNDDTLRSGDWKRVLGIYLVKTKHVLIKWLDGRTEITSQSDIEDLETQLLSAAEETDVLRIPAYQPISRIGLLDGIREISDALAHLEQPDSALLVTREGAIGFNLDFRVSPETIEDLTIRDRIAHEEEMILKVKKPDFLGESKWVFMHERAIEAKIVDTDWLLRFQNGEELLVPGDSIRALVHVEVKYGYAHEVVSQDYRVLRVLRVLHRERPEQRLLGE